MKELLKASFYPTPEKLIKKMIGKIKGDPKKILEPQAGKGDIIKALAEEYDYNSSWSRYKFQGADISAIEIDPDLQATLRGKSIKVIDTDFLAYSGADQFDLIIGNPPFESGDKHLLKALDIMYRGEIVYLLNAETLKNPYTNIRKELVKKLDEVKADIEYIKDGFKTSERPTGVEVALIHINIERSVEDDLFKDIDVDKVGEDKVDKVEDKNELSNGKAICELVAEYNQVVSIGKDTIINYYRNYKKIGQYLKLNRNASDYEADEDMTSKMQGQLNEMLVDIRTDFWRRTLDLPEVKNKMTAKKTEEFNDKVSKCCDMVFTENNIRQFILNLIGSYKQTLTEAVMDIFDKFTIRHCYSNGLYDENIHMFNGWKTNNAFKVGKKVIIPIYGGYGDGPFNDYNGDWKLDYSVCSELQDIDTVMNYFDGRGYYNSIRQALDLAFQAGQSRKIVSTYFTISVYKKGTIHLEFNDMDILRRFNVAACMGKGWLPHSYGKKSYDGCSQEEKNVVEEFEGPTSYNKNLNQPVFAAYNPAQLAGSVV